MRWGLHKDSVNRWSIRRWNKGKNERLPIARYKKILHDEPALRDLVTRLNQVEDTKSKVNLKHAFISPALLDEYKAYLVAKIPSPSGAQTEFTYLVKYFLTFFISDLDLQNPEDWYSVHETKWAAFLLSSKAPKSAKTKRDIVNAANRFMRWLHKRLPDIPLLVFEPISPAKYREVEAKREMHGEVRLRKLIPTADMARIKKACSVVLAPFICLAESYGLRRSESLAIERGAVRKGHLRVSAQLKKLGVLAPLKGREARNINHWFATAAQAYKWAEEAQKYVMNPCTLTHRWTELMQELGMDYDFHDLRHTFITKAARLYPIRDVQLAAGHADIRTTMKYLHDDRDTSDAPYIPEAS